MIIHNNKPIQRFNNCSVRKLTDKTFKSTNIEPVLNESLKKFTERAEREVPEYGRLFAPISEEFKNPDLTSIANRIKFSIKPSTDKANQTGRILKMEIFSQRGNQISPIFECGTKEELLAFLKDEKLPLKIKEIISHAGKMLLKKSLG